MSVDCAVQFADPEKTVTIMTVFDYNADSFDIGRALALACAAYESRMKRPPPLIKEPEHIAGYVDILGMQYRYANGKIETMTGAEYRRTLLFARIFDFKADGDAPQPNGKRRRPRFRSMAEWRELQRQKDLRRIARANSDLQRELLKTFDTCPCCGHRLDKGNPP